ncbi:hypothetical protein CCUS01_02945, partial [Colletotrichum cuscutae]
AHCLLLFFRRFNVLFPHSLPLPHPSKLALFNTIDIKSILQFLHSLPLPVFILAWSLPFLVYPYIYLDLESYPPGVGLRSLYVHTSSPRYPYPPPIHPILSLYEIRPIPSIPHPHPPVSLLFLLPGSRLHCNTHPAICHLLPAPTFETTSTPPCPLSPEPSLLRIPNQIWYFARCILALTAKVAKVNTAVRKRHSEGEPADAMKPF